MQDWDRELYERYREARSWPVRDLVALLPPRLEGRMLDLGCGDGSRSVEVAARLGLSVVGVDSSPAMIAGAAGRPGAFRVGDLRDELQRGEQYALVFTNAVLHWLPDHERLLPQLVAAVAPGGWLAFQMPMNHTEPSHRCMAEVAGWEAPNPRRSPAFYAEELAGMDGVVVEVRTYRQAMAAPEAIVEMLRSTGLRPYLAAADDPEAFLRAYTAAIDRAYPDLGGVRLFDFKRLLAVGRKPPEG